MSCVKHSIHWRITPGVKQYLSNVRKVKWKAKVSTFSKSGCHMLYISIAWVSGLGEAVHSFCGVLPLCKGTANLLLTAGISHVSSFPSVLEEGCSETLLWKLPLDDGLITSFIPPHREWNIQFNTFNRCKMQNYPSANVKKEEIFPDSCQWSALSGW